jgi:hypothetical protein
LLEAFEYAHELDRSVWDFAVEIGELRKAGCTTSSLRWLVCKGFAEHAREAKPPDGGGRTFRRRGKLTFTAKTCFVLTETGIAFARQLIGEVKKRPKPAEDRERPVAVGDLLATIRPLPRWDRDRQELRLGEVVVKRFKVPAANQEQILAAFEEEGWPVHIDDPLSPHPDQDPKRRLHATINALNRNQVNRVIRFRGDGRGEGICWETIEPNENGRESRDPDA